MQDYDIVGILYVLYTSIIEKEEDLGEQELLKAEEMFASGLDEIQKQEYQKIKETCQNFQKKYDMRLIKFVLDFVKKMI